MSDPRTLILRFFGIGGAALFGFFFLLTFHTPRWIEDFGRSYLEEKVLENVDAGIESLALSMEGIALWRDSQANIEQLKFTLQSQARSGFSECIDRIHALDATQRDALERLLMSGAQWRIPSLGRMDERVLGFIQLRYLQITDEVRRDVRIFSASNATAFLLLVMISLLSPGHTRVLFVPGMLLATSTLLCAYLYVFEQNWLLTIIHGSYLGFAYAGWLGAVFLLLCDIWLNGARVTQAILELIGQAVQAIVSILTPC